jgi:hypothetical protein
MWLLLGPPDTFASQEGQLVFDTFSVKSSGIGESGPIAVGGEARQGAILSLRISAFGKEVQLSPDRLQLLTNVSPNGIRLSYERGYQEAGGRTLYVILSRGFTSGEVAAVLVTFHEEGGITIGPVRHGMTRDLSR